MKVTDLPTRLLRLADAAPDVRPDPDAWFLDGHWFVGSQRVPVQTAHALWGWSILTWLGRKDAVRYGPDLSTSREAWIVNVGGDFYRGRSLLEAALSAAESVAGIQKQEVSDASD